MPTKKINNNFLPESYYDDKKVKPGISIYKVFISLFSLSWRSNSAGLITNTQVHIFALPSPRQFCWTTTATLWSTQKVELSRWNPSFQMRIFSRRYRMKGQKLFIHMFFIQPFLGSTSMTRSWWTLKLSAIRLSQEVKGLSVENLFNLMQPLQTYSDFIFVQREVDTLKRIMGISSSIQNKWMMICLERNTGFFKILLSIRKDRNHIP